MLVIIHQQTLPHTADIGTACQLVTFDCELNTFINVKYVLLNDPSVIVNKFGSQLVYDNTNHPEDITKPSLIYSTGPLQTTDTRPDVRISHFSRNDEYQHQYTQEACMEHP